MAKGSCFTVGIEYIMCHPKKCLKVLMIPGDAMLVTSFPTHEHEVLKSFTLGCTLDAMLINAEP